MHIEEHRLRQPLERGEEKINPQLSKPDFVPGIRIFINIYLLSVYYLSVYHLSTCPSPRTGILELWLCYPSNCLHGRCKAIGFWVLVIL